MIKALIIFCSVNLLNAYYSNNKQNDNIQQFRDPCSSIKCAPNELCVLKDAENAICLLRKEIGLEPLFNKREIKTHVCTSHECKYGQCEVVSSNSYKCHCDKLGVVGYNCDSFSITADPCSSNPCWGNSECINLNSTQYECRCKAGRGGSNCMGHTHPCKCQNGGFCSLIDYDVYVCKCPKKFGGYLCQYKMASEETNLKNKSNSKTSCFNKPCLNGGTCTIYSVCLCKSNYTGDFCETNLHPTKPAAKILGLNDNNPQLNICSKNLCLNGGTCSQITQNIAICLCKPEYNGPFCNMKSAHHNIVLPISTTTTSTRLFTFSRTTTSTTTTTTSTTTTTTTTTTTSTTTTTTTTSTSTTTTTTSSTTASTTTPYPFKLPKTTSSFPSPQSLCPHHFSSVCRNSGTCYILSNSILYCLCNPPYSGPFCDDSNDASSPPSPLIPPTTTTLATTTTTTSTFVYTNMYTTNILPEIQSTSKIQYQQVNNEASCPMLFKILCQNGGTCNVPNSNTGSNTYYCECPSGFSGPFCNYVNDKISEETTSTTEISTTTDLTEPINFSSTTSGPVIECPLLFKNLCQNGGTCQYVSGTTTYFCSCTEKYSGPFCNIFNY